MNRCFEIRGEQLSTVHAVSSAISTTCVDTETQTSTFTNVTYSSRMYIFWSAYSAPLNLVSRAGSVLPRSVWTGPAPALQPAVSSPSFAFRLSYSSHRGSSCWVGDLDYYQLRRATRDVKPRGGGSLASKTRTQLENRCLGNITKQCGNKKCCLQQRSDWAMCGCQFFHSV